MYNDCERMGNNYYLYANGKKKITIEVTLLESALNYELCIEENGQTIASKRISSKNFTQCKYFNIPQVGNNQKKIYLRNSSNQIFDPEKILACKYKLE